MTNSTIIDPDLENKHRALWALGDYRTIAAELVAPLGPELAAATAVRTGERVLDVAAGTGNAAFAAAERGADVIARTCPRNCWNRDARRPSSGVST